MHRIYFDNAATSFPKAPGMSDRIKRYLDEEVVNLYRTDSPLEEMVFSSVDNLRAMIADIYGCPYHETIAFTANVTEALNAVIKNFVRKESKVITSSNEHNSVMRPLNQMKADIIKLPSDEEGFICYDSLSSVISPDICAIVVNAASNVTGAVQDLGPIAEEARKYHIPLIIDAAQATPIVPIDMMKLNAAAICFTGHKGLLGPQGTGGMILRRDIAESFAPLVTGGTGSESDWEDVPHYLPDRLTAGTENVTGLVGLEWAVSYVTENIGRIREKERKAFERLYTGLERINGIQIKGPSPEKERTAVVSIVSNKMDIADIAASLSSRYGIETRVGLHCSPSAHKAIGTFPTGTLRISPGAFTTDDEIDSALSALKEILG